MDTKDIKQLLNRIYSELEHKRSMLVHRLAQNGFSVSSGYYNGHYSRDDSGFYEKDDYPIPVISVDGLCDIEIGLTAVSVSAKLTRTDALAFDYAKLGGNPFEVYGVENYLADYYHAGMTFDQLHSNILSSGETEIGFAFSFDSASQTQAMLGFVDFLRAEGFYY